MNIGAVFDEDGFRSKGHDPSLRERAKKFTDVRASLEAERKDYSFSFNSGEERQKTVIEQKSLILAQIERWRHALHMQVERQHRELAPGWRVAHG